ncbi:MAG: cyclic nucleotide-binding domain-containing protein [Planctomycetales bacterium]
MSKSSELSAEVLEGVPIFYHLSEADRRQLAGVASAVIYEEGEVILRQGKISQNLWIVLEGKCEVIKELTADTGDKEEIILAELEPFQSFGEMSFFHSAAHVANVRAATRLKLMRLEREAFDGLLANGSEAAYKLTLNTVTTLAERLRHMDDWVAELLSEAPEGETDAPEWRRFRDKLFEQWSNL